jgi:lipoprotein signal peptidase
MNVGIGPLRTGIFNVADMAIMLGAGIFVLEGYRSARHAPPTALLKQPQPLTACAARLNARATTAM